MVDTSAPFAAPNYHTAFSRAPSSTLHKGTDTGKTALAAVRHRMARRGSLPQEIQHGTGNHSNAGSSCIHRLKGQKDLSIFQADLCVLLAIKLHPAYTAPVIWVCGESIPQRDLVWIWRKYKRCRIQHFPMHFFQQLMKRGLLIIKVRIL